MLEPLGTNALAISRRPYKESCAPLPEIFRGPVTQTLRYRVYPTIEAATEALLRREVDLIDFPVVSTTNLGPDIALDPCRDFGYYYLAFNCRRSPANSKQFRKALAYLLGHVKKMVAQRQQTDRLELMDGIMVQYYGRLVNRYLPSYLSSDAVEAVALALKQLTDFAILPNQVLDGEGNEIPARSVRCLITTDDPTAYAIMSEFKALLEQTGTLASIFDFVELTRNEVANKVYAEGDGDWSIFVGWQYVQDNLSRWNPNMSKLRLSLDWMADFQSDNSYTRNYPRFQNHFYDEYAKSFLTALQPHDLRGAVITEAHLDRSWNNSNFWEDGGNVPHDSSALPLLWKLQWIVADECPVVPLFARSVKFARRADLEGIWNGDPAESFTYPGGSKPIEATYPGGTLSYWTFQRIHKPGHDEVVLGLSNNLRHLNPLGVGNYWDALIWSRVFESLLGLNPFLLMKGVAEDAVNLAESFYTEILIGGRIKQRLHFRIRPEVLWHDGEHFTAEDVAFTFLSILGGRGRLIAQRHPSTKSLSDLLVNERPIPAWVDLAKWLHHIELSDQDTIDLYLTESSRFVHEWFGDMPIVPMHVWCHFGPDFTQPSYQGAAGLHNIRDHSRRAPDGDFSGWNGLVGTGPFVWSSGDDEQAVTDRLNQGGCLKAFKAYHYR